MTTGMKASPSNEDDSTRPCNTNVCDQYLQTKMEAEDPEGSSEVARHATDAPQGSMSRALGKATLAMAASISAIRSTKRTRSA